MQGVNFQLPPGGQFSLAVDKIPRALSEPGPMDQCQTLEHLFVRKVGRNGLLSATSAERGRQSGAAALVVVVSVDGAGVCAMQAAVRRLVGVSEKVEVSVETAVASAGSVPTPAASEAMERVRALWAVEDDVLTRWHRAQADYDAALARQVQVVRDGRRRMTEALRPFTHATWGRAQARIAREEWHRSGPDPVLVDRVAKRLRPVQASLDEADRHAQDTVDHAWRIRAQAVADLREVIRDAHQVLGVSKHALTRATRKS
jgi:hypothetical protein